MLGPGITPLGLNEMFCAEKQILSIAPGKSMAMNAEKVAWLG